jgi:hypothetical protein
MALISLETQSSLVHVKTIVLKPGLKGENYLLTLFKSLMSKPW